MNSMYLSRLLALAFAVCIVCQGQEETVTYPNPEAAGVTLAGTLTKPSSGSPYAAILLIAGPGPMDRDETIGSHKPFQVLADYLTRHGIAVLRVDKRGVGKSTGKFETATTQDFASDAEAGVHYLMTRSDIDPKRIGLLGHGEGGMVAPMVAVNIPQIAFMVLIGAPGVNGEQILLEQTERSEKAAHIPQEQIDADKDIGSMLYKMVREGKTPAQLNATLNSLPEDERVFAAHWQPQVQRMNSPWLHWFLSYDPAKVLEQVKCPVLAIDGEKDMQLNPERNLNAIKSALSHGGNHNVTLHLFPGLNYLLQPAKTGLGWEYETIKETIAPEALDLIGNWVAQHTTAAEQNRDRKGAAS
jgi:pimeloyl-ACP methyl ester carboxylesterase